MVDPNEIEVLDYLPDKRQITGYGPDRALHKTGIDCSQDGMGRCWYPGSFGGHYCADQYGEYSYWALFDLGKPMTVDHMAVQLAERPHETIGWLDYCPGVPENRNGLTKIGITQIAEQQTGKKSPYTCFPAAPCYFNTTDDWDLETPHTDLNDGAGGLVAHEVWIQGKKYIDYTSPYPSDPKLCRPQEPIVSRYWRLRFGCGGSPGNHLGLRPSIHHIQFCATPAPPAAPPTPPWAPSPPLLPPSPPAVPRLHDRSVAMCDDKQQVLLYRQAKCSAVSDYCAYENNNWAKATKEEWETGRWADSGPAGTNGQPMDDPMSPMYSILHRWGDFVGRYAS